MNYTIAVVGATGAVGREMLSTLARRNFPTNKVIALASDYSAGNLVSYGENKTLVVEKLAKFDFSKIDIALFSAGKNISLEYAPKASQSGCVVIDNSSAFRTDPEVPLIVPEVNLEAMSYYDKKNIIANPNCSTAQMVVALKPIHDSFCVKRVLVATYQSVSGAGNDGIDELFKQSHSIYLNNPIKSKTFTKKIAFNVIPHIDNFMDDGFTKEEWKMTFETKKILDQDIEVVAHCVRVPVFIGHSEAIFIETKKPINPESARQAMQSFPGLVVVDNPSEASYSTPLDSAGKDAVYVSRLRKDPTVNNGLVLWCVSDNLRKGAALNAVQIAENLAANFLKKNP
ncbi:aspartate-semialdehyde dehydrogenase [Candidatus Endolissoclinum faulkneri L5]|uniref:Aspartate-semialdehyde dehydrogenase n=1 Tax=Candidatus Endolissoclinum faulkneri L5 TaxID=1401328 RepID=V9TVE7_9PROT|nr:aspartate-semialdehyde dehydrogenase [Candidatus Endolissoclinum faulkneri]AHC73290.1 aspartate-semialdehyde dehydrogenase [Candidatus Endolissoclinum faulkneri L5]